MNKITLADRASARGWEDGINDARRKNTYKRKKLRAAYEDGYKRGKQLGYQKMITEC